MFTLAQLSELHLFLSRFCGYIIVVIVALLFVVITLIIVVIFSWGSDIKVKNTVKIKDLMCLIR